MVCLAGGIGFLALRDGEQRADLTPDPASPSSPDPAAAATALFAELEELLVAGDPSGVGSLTSPDDRAAQRELAAITANARALKVADLGLRYVAEADLELPAEADLGTAPFVVEARLTWRFRGVESSPSSSEVPVVLSWLDGEAVFESARLTEGYRVPLWFIDRVSVRRTPDTLVLATRPRRARVLQRQALAAVQTVRRTIPAWREPLVVEEPASEAQFEAASGLSAQDAKAIAAVTTSTDGSGLAGSPVHIYLNAQVFGPLGPQGQQIVVSHEAAHVALGAATSQVPLWLSEGIADYVALVDTRLPVAVLAAQIRRLVRTSGPPSDLPASPEFDGANRDIGAWYEAAWLAAQLIAQQHGQAALLDFYRSVDRTGDVDRAFRSVLGTTERAFVRDWRDRLVSLAR